MSTVETITIVTPNVDSSELPLVTDIQYLEPFTSTALNRKFCGIVRAGVFRGFACEPGGGLNLAISHTKNQTGESVTFGVALAEREDYLLTVRQQHDIQVAIPAGQVSYVVIEVFFQHGVETSQVNANSVIEAASIKVLPQADVQEHHVILCVADVPSGVTTLTLAHLRFDEREIGGYDLEGHLADADAHQQYVKKAGDVMTGDLQLPNISVSGAFKWAKPGGGSLIEMSGSDGTAAFINWGAGHNVVRFNKGESQSENSSDFYGQLRENGARVFSPNNKPTWADIGGNNYWAINANQSDRLEAQAKWIVAAPSRGVIAAANGDGLLGTTGTRWNEAWVNTYRGSNINIGGTIVAGSTIQAKGAVYQQNENRAWGMGLATSSSTNKGVVGITLDNGATFSDYIRIGPNRELIHHVTVNNAPEEYDIYTKFRKPTADELSVVSRAGDTMTGQLVVPSVVTQEADTGGLWCGDRQAVYGHVTSTWLYLNNKGHFTSGVFLGGQGVARHDSAFSVGSWTLDGATLLRKGQSVAWGAVAQAALSARHADSTSAVWMLGSYADDQSNTMRAGLQIMRAATGEMRLYTNNLAQYVKVADGQLYMSNSVQLNSPYAATRKGYVDAQDDLKVNKSGDVMTGPLTIEDEIYVDALNFTLGGSVMSWDTGLADRGKVLEFKDPNTSSNYAFYVDKQKFNTSKPIYENDVRVYSPNNPPPSEIQVPIGVPFPWPTDVAPDGFAIMKGQAFDTVACPALALIFPDGLLWDMRGVGLLGKEDNETVGDYEEGQVKSHGHPGSAVLGTDLGTKTTDANGNHYHASNTPNEKALNATYGSGFASSVNTNSLGRHASTSTAGNHSHTVAIGSHAHTVEIALYGGLKNTINHRKVNWIVRLA